MMQPCQIIRLGPQVFHTVTACLGWQLTEVLRAIAEVRTDLLWHVADVQAVGPSPTHHREPSPSAIGDTVALIQAVANVSQFESGVFVGVPSQVVRPTFRPGGLWTEDDEDADLGDAI